MFHVLVFAMVFATMSFVAHADPPKLTQPTFNSEFEDRSKIIGTPATGYIEADAKLKVGATIVELQKDEAKNIFPDSPKKFTSMFEKKDDVSKEATTIHKIEPLEVRKGAVLSLKKTTYEQSMEGGSKNYYFIQKFELLRAGPPTRRSPR
ncbi:MAG: hypothetical protein H7326_10415 [Bdellovibrionaceae bacterium]|nr:hypothetical protein [Pseudobdellovibrionaceae bacterium]